MWGSMGILIPHRCCGTNGCTGGCGEVTGVSDRFCNVWASRICLLTADLDQVDFGALSHQKTHLLQRAFLRAKKHTPLPQADSNALHNCLNCNVVLPHHITRRVSSTLGPNLRPNTPAPSPRIPQTTNNACRNTKTLRNMHALRLGFEATACQGTDLHHRQLAKACFCASCLVFYR